MIQGLPIAENPTEILTQAVDGRQARVLPLNELKEKSRSNRRRCF